MPAFSRVLPSAVTLGLALGSGCASDPSVVVATCQATFPRPPTGYSSVIYVAQNCPSADADGSAAHPYGSISAALGAAPGGGAIVVGSGTYGENITDTNGTSIYGSDADSTDPNAAGAVVVGTQANTVVANGSTPIVLHGLKIQAPAVAGIFVQGGTVTIEASAVQGATADATGAFGYGIYAGHANLTVSHVAVDGCASTGILVDSSSAAITNSSVTKNGLGGIRIQAGQGMVTVGGNTIDGNTQLGIGVFSTTAQITNNVVSNTVATLAVDPTTQAIDDVADGVIVSSQSDAATDVDTNVELSGNTISGVGRMGVLFHVGSTGNVHDNTITANGFGSMGLFGGGIWVQHGAGGPAGVTIATNTITANHFVGVGLTSNASAKVVHNVAISGTKGGTVFAGASSGTIGDGVQIFDGAAADVTDNVIDANERFGFIADGVSGDTTTCSANTVTNSGDTGAVVQDDAGTSIPLDGNSYSGNAKGDSATVAMGKAPYFVRTAEVRVVSPIAGPAHDP